MDALPAEEEAEMAASMDRLHVEQQAAEAASLARLPGEEEVFKEILSTDTPLPEQQVTEAAFLDAPSAEKVKKAASGDALPVEEQSAETLSLDEHSAEEQVKDTTSTDKPLVEQQASKAVSLDALPAEIKKHILLLAPNFPSLRDLDLSSPVLHQVDLEHRYEILRHIVVNHSARPENLYEFASVIRARNSRRRNKWSKERVDFLESYRPRELHEVSDILQGLTVDQLAEMVKLMHDHRLVLMEYWEYLRGKLGAVRDSKGRHLFDEKELIVNLSDNEKRRFSRALCRFDLKCALALNFPTRYQDPELERSYLTEEYRQFTEDEKTRRRNYRALQDSDPQAAETFSRPLRNKLQPWEEEEIGIFEDFAVKYYHELMHELHKTDPVKCSQLELWAYGEEHRLHTRQVPDYSVPIRVSNKPSALISLGTGFLANFMIQKDPVDYALRSAWWERCPMSPTIYVDRSLCFEHYPSAELSSAWQFCGDENPSGPNLAWSWVIQSGGIEPTWGLVCWLRRWAYVMWDKGMVNKKPISKAIDWHIATESGRFRQKIFWE